MVSHSLPSDPQARVNYLVSVCSITELFTALRIASGITNEVVTASLILEGGASAAASNPDSNLSPTINATPAQPEGTGERWYVVTVGRKVGIFTDMSEATSYTTGISGNRLRGYSTREKAENVYADALANNMVKIVRPERMFSAPDSE